ncbi:vacuolar protein-sorting protein 36 [Bacillus mycoides]|uniref:vacuolar protein-sorting protein 36 n=1 Tax=Bacillus mycoides TaxID=1405 RepID=UPI003A7F682C
MGVTWTYFKQFEIVEHEENDFNEMIRYFDQGELRFTYTTSGTLRAVFANYGIHIPIYSQFEPPNSKKLELVSPDNLVHACEDAIKVLKEGINPEFKSFDGEKSLLWELEDLDGRNGGSRTIVELNTRIIDDLKRIKSISSKGYYIIENEQ